MNSTEFWALINSVIDVSMSVFNLLDSAVVIDSPRFSMFDFMVAVIFLGLLMKLITWLRGGGVQVIRNQMGQKASWKEGEYDTFEFDLAMEQMGVNDPNRRF
jgi:hypothetical protein